MEREDISKFTNSIILLAKLFTTMEDRFLKQKLYSKISDLVFAFVKQKSAHSPASHNSGFRNVNNIAKSNDIAQHSPNVAQYCYLNLINSINNLIDFLEYLAHTSKNEAAPLLVAQKDLLKFKLHILQQKKNGRPSSEVEPQRVERLSPLEPVPASQRKSKIGSGKLKSNSNKERIFNYIKKTPEVRARDIMSEFSALSSRTVKRSLKELTDEGFLKKISDGGAVYYLPTD